MGQRIFFVMLVITSLYSQTNWSKYVNNPVMTKTNILTEFYAIGQPTVILENDTFKMWYCAAGIDHRSRILYAYSLNGINWTKYQNGGIVLNIGSAGEWDSKWLDTPEIVRTANNYKLYYFGDDVDTFPPHIGAIGVALSNNGINWTKYAGNPILTKGDSLSWEAKWIESPAVIYDNGVYKMWYTGVGFDWRIKIGYATSFDGLAWTKYANNPVVGTGSSGSFDDYWVGVPTVIKRGSLYEMWYSALSEADLADGRYDTIRIGYATSFNGIHWNKYSNNPVLSTLTPPHNPAVDTNGPWAPSVVYDGYNYRMWYESAIGFCYATAPLNILEQEDRTSIDFFIRPNPMRLFTQIKFPGSFKVVIYNITGKEIRKLNGINQVFWDGKDYLNKQVSTGIYFLKLITETYKITKKVIVF